VETSFRNSLAARPGGRGFGQAATIFRCGFGDWSERYSGKSPRSRCIAIAGISEMPKPAGPPPAYNSTNLGKHYGNAYGSERKKVFQQ
jgi:hypothetical protein